MTAPSQDGLRLQKIGVMGAGAFGTALAIALRRAGRKTLLWARRPEQAAELRESSENRRYLPGIALDPEITITAEIEALATCDALLLAMPAQNLRQMTLDVADVIANGQPLVSCAKGIEHPSLKLMSEVLAETLPGRPVAVLSGPTFAAEVARGCPSAITLAAEDPALGSALVAALGSRLFRPYYSDDPVGAQVGGAVKNVLAIACGIVAGRALGDNTRAALITRGLAEITRLGQAMGARPTTLMGLSGLGDLTLTCSAMQSRNFSLGYALGEGRQLEEILAERRTVTEGVHSAGAVCALARRHQLEMPIAAAVDAIVNRAAAVDETINALLNRPFRAESA